MVVSIVDHGLPHETHDLYDVTVDGTTIRTLLTHDASIVSSWLSGIHPLYGNRIVGLDIEWRPNFQRGIINPVAILQLCVGSRCLIFQLIHAVTIPQSLFAFLGNAVNTFVGVGIEKDVEKLLSDYDLHVSTFVDLGSLSAYKLGMRELKTAGLKSLAFEVLGKEIEKPKSVTLSRWDNLFLNWDQVMYACVDAYVSFEIGRRLYSMA